MEFAQQLLAGLHTIITDMKQHFGLIKVRVLDVPCGDVQYMSRFLEGRDDIIYTGIDIVPDLIEHHRKTYADRPWTFRTADIVTDSTSVNNFDVIISRMMMQHLQNADVFNVLKKLSSETRHPSFLFATTYSSYPTNIELNTNVRGRARYQNLELEPFRLEPPICLLLDGPYRARKGHYMGLWRLPLMTIPKYFCENGKKAAFTTKLSRAPSYSCVSWNFF